MKLSYTFNVSKSEMNSIKEFAVATANRFGASLSKEDLSASIRQKMTVKFTAGNLLAFVNLKDTYDVSVDMDIDESYLIEYMNVAARALPLVGGLINVVKELEKLNTHQFAVLDSKVVDFEVE